MTDDRPDEEQEFEGIRIIGGESPEDDVAPGKSVFDAPAEDPLPPWNEPPTGEMPAAPAAPETPAPAAGDDQAWSTLNTEGPRWAETGGTGDTGGVRPVPPAEPVGETQSAGGEQFFSFEDDGDAFRDFDERVPDFNPSMLPPDDPAAPAAAPAAAAPVAATGVPGAPAAEPAPRAGQPAPTPGADRNVPMAAGTAVALVVLAGICFAVGSWAVVILVTALLTVAAAEFFNAVRPAGYQPPVLLGVTAVAGMSLAAYWRGEVAIPLVLVLVVVFGGLWYLWPVTEDNPVANLGITHVGVIWIGVLGSFAALMLRSPDGLGLLLGAIVVTVAYDLGAWVIGRAMGSQPLSPASPNKTVEGLIGGCVAAIAAGIIMTAFVHPWSASFADALLLGLFGAAMAPLGDLIESLIKRDLGLKDMGTFLPGHGGLLDRFDAMLFVLPAVYYLAHMQDLI